jgi:hypothetical protein
MNTNGKGCRLAGRVRREIAARPPHAVCGAISGVARLRNLAKAGGDDVEAEAEAGEDGRQRGGAAVNALAPDAPRDDTRSRIPPARSARAGERAQAACAP